MILRSGKIRDTSVEITVPILDNNKCSPAVNSCVRDAMSTDAEEPPAGRFAIKRMIFEWPKDDVGDASKEANKKPKLPPPIIVPTEANKKPVDKPLVDQLKAILKENLSQGSYSIKLGLHAIIINVTDTSTHTKTETTLKSNNINYFTYQANDTTIKKRKFIIYGLGDIDVDELQDDLQKYGLKPLDIKRMTIKNPRYEGHNNYIIYFDQSDKLTLPLLQRAKHLCSTVVKWAHYREPADRVTQCTNCWRFGHTNTGCHLPVTCMFCAKNHNASQCPLVRNKTESGAACIPTNLLKCPNCKEHHTAINKLCASRVSFIQKRSNHHPPKNTTPAIQEYSIAPQPTTIPWTTVQPTKQTPVNAALNTSIVTPKTTFPATSPSMKTPRSRTLPAPSRSINQPPRQTPLKVTYAPTPKRTASNLNENNHENLFTPQELMKIFQEMVGSMAQCTTKNEQLNALFEIALKYSPCRD